MMEKPFKGLGSRDSAISFFFFFNSGDSIKEKIERQEIEAGQPTLTQLPEVRTVAIAILWDVDNGGGEKNPRGYGIRD